MKSKTTRHGLKRMTALLLAVVLCVGMVPSAFAAQEDIHWQAGILFGLKSGRASAGIHPPQRFSCLIKVRGIFYTELTTGLRRGEICGLQWRDFDADDGRLKICRAVHEERGGKLTTWDTKTSAGARTITLPPSTVELLRERKKSALTEWIFPHPWKPEQPTHPSTAYDRLKALLKRAELPDIRFHGLHHTFATHALASGVDVKTLSGILGHTRSAFTQDTYPHH